MSVPPELGEILAQWVKKAEHDLEAANRIFALEEGCPFDTVCFHSQQVVEKYIKCLLTLRGIEAPRTHDLRLLAMPLQGDSTLPAGVEQLAELNPYAVQVRYAGDWPEPMCSDARRALEVARAVRNAIRKVLPSGVLASEDPSNAEGGTADANLSSASD